MQDNMKQALAIAVREARTELGLSQEKLAETLNLDTRTILNIEAGRGNPKFEKLPPLITYLKIPANKIFCKRTIVSTCFSDSFSVIIVSYNTELKKLST